jgi:hypothetical protein
MECKTSNPAAKRFMRRNLITMLLYVLSLVLAIGVFLRYHPTGVLAYLLAVLPAIPLTGLLAIFGLYLAEEKDEFQRSIGVQSMLWGIGGTLAVTNIWGFLESFVHLRHLNPSLDAVIFWIFVGISIPFLLRRYR